MLYEKDYHMYYKYTRCPENRTMGYGMCGYWQLKAHRIIWQHIGFRICAVFISKSAKALLRRALGVSIGDPQVPLQPSRIQNFILIFQNKISI